MRLILTLAALAFALPNLAFFDDFDGNALKPHWSVDYGEGNTNRWDYTVSGDWLTVHRLYQSNGQPGGVVRLVGGDRLYEDFDISARVGRESGISSVNFGIGDNPTRPDHSITYGRISGGTPLVCGFIRGHAPVCRDIFEPADITLRLTRVNRLVSLYVDSELLYSGVENQHVRMGGLQLTFRGGWDEPFAPLKVDWVHAVPEPSSVIFLGLGLTMVLRATRMKGK